MVLFGNCIYTYIFFSFTGCFSEHFFYVSMFSSFCSCVYFSAFYNLVTFSENLSDFLFYKLFII